MATIGGTNPTLLDIARIMGENDKLARIIELLAKHNEVLMDFPFIEGNLLTGHKSTQRNGLPDAYWRKINEGVPSSKSTSRQITDACGNLEAYSEPDKDLVDLANNAEAFKVKEAKAFLEAMSQKMATALFYGDTTLDPEQFMGLVPRFDTPSTDEDASGYNMINGQGSGSDNLSIWLVVLGEDTVHGIYPKGSKAGFQMNDKGQVTVQDADNNNYEAYRTHFKWQSGIVVADWRYVVRYCNIDVSDLTKDASGSSTDIIDGMIQMLEIVENLTNGKPVFYCNRTVRSFLRRQILAKSNVNLTFENVAGKRVLFFDEVPVRRTDALLSTEATVAGTFAHSA